MDEPFDQDLMEYWSADSPPASADDAFTDDAFNAFEGMEESSDFAEDEFVDEAVSMFGDDLTEADYDTETAIAALEDEMADALEAKDSDEFLRRVAQGVRRAAQIARSAGQVVGQAARAVAPIASAIPLPQAQALGRVASVAGRLLADGADEFEALDELLAFAEADEVMDAAIPVIAGLTVRTIMPRAARLPQTTRRQLVRSVSQSTRTLARRQGPRVIRAIPRVVQAVQRTAQRRRIPANQLPQAVHRTAARIASNPRLVGQLVRTIQPVSAVTCGCRHSRARTGAPQRLVMQGPVEITIRSR
jgi:hypothetical protein